MNTNLDFIDKEINEIEAKYPQHFKEKGVKLKDCISLFRYFDISAIKKPSPPPGDLAFSIGFSDSSNLPDNVTTDLRNAIHLKIVGLSNA